MNYLKEISAFSVWKEVNLIPASAIALWYELMSINNKCGWSQEFTVPNGLLQIKAGLSRKQFDAARLLLIQKGRITYRKSKSVNQAGVYTIIPFPIVQNGQQEGQQTVQQKVQQKVQQEGQQTVHRNAHETDTLIKDKQQTETKQKDKKIERAPHVLLTDAEFQKLTDQFGNELTKDYIERLSLYIGSSGKHYKDHYMTILNWHRKDMEKYRQQTNQSGKVKEPRSWDALRRVAGEMSDGGGFQ